MANDIICEISSKNEIVVEINGMTYQSVAAELAEKASVEDVALKADKTYVDSQDLLKADKQQEAWITPTFINGATADPNDPFKYRKNQMGVVETKGKIIVVSQNPCLKFPVGYRTGINQSRRYCVAVGTQTGLAAVASGDLYASVGTVDFNGFRFISEG